MQARIIRSRWYFSLKFLLPFLTLLIIIGGLFGAYYWVKGALAAVNPAGQEETFTIAPNTSITTIAKNLKEAGLINNEVVFRLYTRFTCTGSALLNPLSWLKATQTSACLSGKIQAGVFKLSSADNLETLARKLTDGKPLETWVKVIEGLRDEEVAKIFEEKLGIKQADFLALAREGYMFPDTYLFQTEGTSAQIVANKLTATFDKKFTPVLQAEAQAQGLNSTEAVTLASIVQREAGNEEDAPAIASVFLNRLKIGMPLGSDVTVQFALGYDAATQTWWKKDLDTNDLAIDSPYNTRANAGLPPGPISNPGLAALKAVAEPATTDYLYFLYGTDGSVHFAKTLDEHNANKAKYL